MTVRQKGLEEEGEEIEEGMRKGVKGNTELIKDETVGGRDGGEKETHYSKDKNSNKKMEV